MRGGHNVKPAVLHRVEGSVRNMTQARRNRMEGEPQASGDVGEGLAGFSPAQKTIWDRLHRDCPPGLLTRCDQDVLASYCLIIAARDEAMAAFNGSGGRLLVRRKGYGMVLHPAMRELMRLVHEQRLVGSELGLSPSSRARVTVEPAGDEDALRKLMKSKA